MKKTVSLIIILILMISCSKSDSTPEEANFFQELVSVVGFTTIDRLTGGGFSSENEMGIAFKPKFNGRVTAFALKLPVIVNEGVKVTLWDFATKTKITETLLNITAIDVDFKKEITPVLLEKNKEYVLSFNSIYSYNYSKTEKIVYPFESKNFTITDYLFHNGSKQIFPNSSISDFNISGDCSFVFQITK